MMIFYPNDKVKINLDTSAHHGLEGIITNPLGGRMQVRIEVDGNVTEHWYWDDEVILIGRNTKKT